MSFVALIPARLASTRLPNKPLADLAGLPMVVRVARQAQLAQPDRVVVAADHEDILQACAAHEVEAVLTRVDHANGSDRLAEACDLLGLPDDAVVVNVQGDEPLIDPGLIQACAALLQQDTEAVMGTAAHRLHDAQDIANPNVVKVVCDARQRAMYFSRAPIPWWRDAPSAQAIHPTMPVLRHIGIYSYRAGFLRRYPQLPPSPVESVESLEQLRVLWHGLGIAVHVSAQAPHGGVDTPEDLARVRVILSENP